MYREKNNYNFFTSFLLFTKEIFVFIHDFMGESQVALHSYKVCKVLFNFFLKKKEKGKKIQK